MRLPWTNLRARRARRGPRRSIGRACHLASCARFAGGRRGCVRLDVAWRRRCALGARRVRCVALQRLGSARQTSAATHAPAGCTRSPGIVGRTVAAAPRRAGLGGRATRAERRRSDEPRRPAQPPAPRCVRRLATRCPDRRRAPAGRQRCHPHLPLRSTRSSARRSERSGVRQRPSLPTSRRSGRASGSRPWSSTGSFERRGARGAPEDPALRGATRAGLARWP
jgi:hypothetical protein